MVNAMNPALETLLLPFSRGEIDLPPRALFLGAEAHPELSAWPELCGWQASKPLADLWQKAGHRLCERPSGSWPVVLLLPGKSRDEALAALALGYDLLEVGGTLVVAAANLAGAQRLEKDLAAAAGPVCSSSKHKCRVFHATKHPDWNPQVLATWRELGARRQIDGFTVEAGIFSADHIDPGSALLAAHLPNNLRGRVADLGAGWGFLARACLDRNPTLKEIHLFEADSRALDCARENLPEDLFRFHWHDVTTGLDDKFEAVVMNPPFHSGQATDIGLGLGFLRSAAASLRMGGRIFLVANRQLPYEAELDALGLTWRKVVEDSTYKLLFAERRFERPAEVRRPRR
ncbi:MAG: class I SAM-dependent methyltransferase [Verrucomicrobia bacterium]|nr:MAG: class I SAM-dependent methyltransferase [Verrucomicrobiota bacterium]TAE88320.1 MAG: class I SAM-dependent methyltransferase [Verrucomicrobiota bacterium]TAF26774.1 MAG: class I SAM-dependent methyltransferase [Verrucomicrobiota bacterium]TAF42030.1 MAG: class I SAM-dependent methyltransferase [Verrucomicrobiota bacterium]